MGMGDIAARVTVPAQTRIDQHHSGNAQSPVPPDGLRRGGGQLVTRIAERRDRIRGTPAFVRYDVQKPFGRDGHAKGRVGAQQRIAEDLDENKKNFGSTSMFITKADIEKRFGGIYAKLSPKAAQKQ